MFNNQFEIVDNNFRYSTRNNKKPYESAYDNIQFSIQKVMKKYLSNTHIITYTQDQFL